MQLVLAGEKIEKPLKYTLRNVPMWSERAAAWNINFEWPTRAMQTLHFNSL